MTGTSALVRSAQVLSSSTSKALPRLSIRTRCSTSAKSVLRGAPTFWVGESWVTSAGWDSSMPTSSRMRVSYSASEITGLPR